MRLDLTLPAIQPIGTVLLVDDNPDIVYLLRFQLQREGYAVQAVTNGRDAAEFVESNAPAGLVLTDLMLPYMDGFELISRIRENRRWRSVPVIVLSARKKESDIVRALHLGADDFVMKPYNPQELIARIRRHTGIRQAS